MSYHREGPVFHPEDEVSPLSSSTIDMEDQRAKLDLHSTKLSATPPTPAAEDNHGHATIRGANFAKSRSNDSNIAHSSSPPLRHSGVKPQTLRSHRSLGEVDLKKIRNEYTATRNPSGWKGEWLRRWKNSKLYRWTSTGHEDECAFECSNVAGRRCRYWPPMYKQADLDASRWLRFKRFWTFYIRPAIVMVTAVLFALWFFQQMNNFTTWRTNAMADKHNYAVPGTISGNLDTQISAGEQLPPQNVFFLDDLLHELIPPAAGITYTHWHMFVDGSLIAAIVGSLLFRLAMRDMVRLGEWAAVAFVMFMADGILHVVTVYPDPWASNGSCQSRTMRTYGSWMWYHFTSDYCGDQMFSGHTFNFLTALIMFRRVWYDFIGWDTLPLTAITHSTSTYTRKMDQVTQLGMGVQNRTCLPEPGSEDEKLGRPRGMGWGDCTIRNRDVLTQLPDDTSLPGIDKDGEALEALEPLPIGSSILQCVKLAHSEGLDKKRAIELGRLMRMPIHGQVDATAINENLLQPRVHEVNDIESANYSQATTTTQDGDPSHDSTNMQQQHPHHQSNKSEESNIIGIEPTTVIDLMHRCDDDPAQRVIRVTNGPLGDDVMASLPPNALHDAQVGEVNVPRLLRTRPLALSAPIPASHGGPHVGGHYGASEGNVNNSRLWRSTGHSDLPCPEWDDVRGHGMNASLRYRINMPMRERIIQSRAPPPYFARAYPRATYWTCNALRLILIGWTAVFLFGIIRIRYHYSADVLVSILVTMLVTTNEKLLQALVPYFYLPIDARYSDAPMYPFSIDPQLYEETLSKIGVGGLL